MEVLEYESRLNLVQESFHVHAFPFPFLRESVKAALHPAAKYEMVRLVRLVGMMLIVYVKESLKKNLKLEAAEVVGTGLLGKMVSRYNM